MDDFFTKAIKLLDTQAKASLWFYLLPILEEDHQDYVKQYLDSKSIRFDATPPRNNSIYSSMSMLPNKSTRKPNRRRSRSRNFDDYHVKSLDFDYEENNDEDDQDYGNRPNFYSTLSSSKI